MADEKKEYQRGAFVNTMIFLSQKDELTLTAGRQGTQSKFVLKISNNVTLYIRDQDAILKLIECLQEWKSV